MSEKAFFTVSLSTALAVAVITGVATDSWGIGLSAFAVVTAVTVVVRLTSLAEFLSELADSVADFFD